MIKSLIIDDEKHCCESLQWQLQKYCPNVEIVALCLNAETALQEIRNRQPQLIFLDVEMEGMNGFEMLAQLKQVNFNIIFTTGFDKYAIKAIKAGAVDYLLKPVDSSELRIAVEKLPALKPDNFAKHLDAILSYASNIPSVQKIAFPTLHGFELIAINNIIACESNSNYTTVYTTGSKPLVVSRTLKQIEELLDKEPFVRVHHSYLVNINYAIRYIKGEGGFLQMQGDLTVPVSRSRKERVIAIITSRSV